MESLEITRFESAGDAGGKLAGSELHRPVPSSPYSLKLRGSVLGHDGPPRRVRVVASGPPRRVLVATAPNTSEPGGFSTAASLLGVPPQFSLEVEAAFEGAPPVVIGRIEGRRPRVQTGYASRLQPILLKTLGRAGSTWVTHVLGAHPQALAYRPFDFEPRMLDYWMEILRTLSQPHGYAQTLDPQPEEDRGWWLGRRRSLGPLDVSREPLVERWLETESIEELAAFALARVDAFYGRVAASEEKDGALRFVERAHEWHEIVLAEELYDDAREVFLVRDLRDVLASRIAFNKKRGVAQFGYDGVESDEAYVHGVMRREAEDLLEFWRARGRRALLLRYEDLMHEPQETLRAVFDHAGLDSAEDTVAETLQSARSRAPERQLTHRTVADETASIGRWRSDLAPAVQAACEEALAEALGEFGYSDGQADTRRPG